MLRSLSPGVVMDVGAKHARYRSQVPATEYLTLDLRSDEGQTMSEYGILLALVAAVVLVTLLVFGNVVVGLWNNVNSALGG